MELFSDIVPKYVALGPSYIHHLLIGLLFFSGPPRISVSCAQENTGLTRDRRAIRMLPSIGELSLVLYHRTVSRMLTSQHR